MAANDENGWWLDAGEVDIRKFFGLRWIMLTCGNCFDGGCEAGNCCYD